MQKSKIKHVQPTSLLERFQGIRLGIGRILQPFQKDHEAALRPDSRIRTKSGLVVLLEGLYNSPDTQPKSLELLGNDCTATIVIIRTVSIVISI